MLQAVEKINGASILLHNGREIRKVPSELMTSDRLGTWKARWGMGRMDYSIAPGIYATGNPTSASPVLVSANYKMSFDALRSSMSGRDAWILVLDTKGINVWCAAGKGTFGTMELVGRIADVKLEEIVDHRELIVPQLGATGVSAHMVKKFSGFKVIYGPVRAGDLPAFMNGGRVATDEMRRVRFPFVDRMVLTPMELVGGLKYIAALVLVAFVLSGFSRDGFSVDLLLSRGIYSALVLLFGYLAGCILGPALLPWLPGRAFAAKGFWVGVLAAAVSVFYWWSHPGVTENTFGMAGLIFMVFAIASFIVMNFTGSSTYTSLSGVKAEMRIAVPAQVTGAVLGLGLWIAGRFL